MTRIPVANQPRAGRSWNLQGTRAVYGQHARALLDLGRSISTRRGYDGRPSATSIGRRTLGIGSEWRPRSTAAELGTNSGDDVGVFRPHQPTVSSVTVGTNGPTQRSRVSPVGHEGKNTWLTATELPVRSSTTASSTKSPRTVAAHLRAGTTSRSPPDGTRPSSTGQDSVTADFNDAVFRHRATKRKLVAGPRKPAFRQRAPANPPPPSSPRHPPSSSRPPRQGEERASDAPRPRPAGRIVRDTPLALSGMGRGRPNARGEGSPIYAQGRHYNTSKLTETERVVAAWWPRGFGARFGSPFTAIPHSCKGHRRTSQICFTCAKSVRDEEAGKRPPLAW